MLITLITGAGQILWALSFIYRKASIFYYLAIVLVLPALSWFVFMPSVNYQLVPWYAMFVGVISYISYMEYRGMFDEPEHPEKSKKTGPGLQ